MAWFLIFKALFLSPSALSLVLGANTLEAITSLISSRICSASVGGAGVDAKSCRSLLNLSLTDLWSLDI